MELCRDVLAGCDTGEGTRAVALRFGVSESWVRRILQERREQGKTAPSLPRRRLKTWELHAAWILGKLEERRTSIGSWWPRRKKNWAGKCRV